MDMLTPERRSWNMSRIRGRNTVPELSVRSRLHQEGFRFRVHRELPGRPDIVLPKYRVIIFVHGCFWHRHPGCRFTYLPKTNRTFWSTKFTRTKQRDIRNAQDLEEAGWTVYVVWECDAAGGASLATALSALKRQRRRMKGGSS